MKTVKPNSGAKSTGLFPVVVLFLILAFLFWRSFLPDYVHFNNDGPLGQQNTAWQKLPGAFTGMWDDLNETGYSSGSFSPCVSILIKWLLGPVGFAKFYAPIGLFILGLGAWTFLRSLKLTPLAALLGAIAIFLSPTFCGGACWGIAAVEIAVGLDFFALALLTTTTAGTSWVVRWLRVGLAGLCVGMNVIEAADIGALCSVFVAIFAFYKFIIDEPGSLPGRIVHGACRVAVVAVFAGVIAAQAIVSLIGANVSGIDTQTKQEHWDFATQFSLPKKETLGIIIPGLFGYKYDTPKDMMPLFKDDYENGVYWGGIGRWPAVDRFIDSGAPGPLPGSGLPFGYAGYYCSILATLVAIWVIAQSFRRDNSMFSVVQKKYIWFWVVVLIFSLLVAWGRFAPAFYGTLYAIPYFSFMRNPVKFIMFFCCALNVLFAYGVNALDRRYLDPIGPKPSGIVSQLQIWWKKAGSFDRRWTFGSLIVLLAGIGGWFYYNSKSPELISYLQKIGFQNDNPEAGNSATAIAAFSLHQAVWGIGLIAVAMVLFLLIIAGYFSGWRSKMGMLLLGGFLVFDLGRVDLAWIIHWDYKQKYEVGTLNPIVSFLRDKPYEHRVAYGIPQPLPTPPDYQAFEQLYHIEWMQHHFPYYNIQCLDRIQMPRVPADLQAYLDAFQVRGIPTADGREMVDPQSYPIVARHWALTNTRYLLGPAGLVDLLNAQFDPVQHSFGILQRFSIALKPGVGQFHQRLEELTAVLNDNGEYAIIDYTNALPRVKLYSNWQVNTNDTMVLNTLVEQTFDPHKTVLVSTPQKDLPAISTNDLNPGTVDFSSYQDKKIVLNANAAMPSILLMNDKYDPQWKVTVDGKPAELLRCNFLMRGVYLQPGNHTVEFDFNLPTGTLYVTSVGVVLGLIFCVLLLVLRRKTTDEKPA